MLLPVGGVLIAHHAAGLAGEALGDHGVVLGHGEQSLLVARRAPGLGGGDEPRADPDTFGAEGQRGGEATAIEEPTGGDDGNGAVDGVDDLRHERHGGDGAGMAAGFGALRDHEITPGAHRGEGVADLAAHAGHEHVVVVAEVDDIARHAEPGHEHAAAVVDDRLHLRRHVGGHGGEQIDTEGLAGGIAHGDHLGLHAGEAHGGRAHAAEAAGLAHRGHEGAVADTAHAGEHDGVFDLEEVSQSGLHGRHGRRPGR